MSMDSEEIEKKFSKIFRFLGVVTDLQIDFLKEHQLLPTFCDLILIGLAEGFNLRYMTVLRSQKLKNYSDFRGGDGPSSRFFERASTFLNFLRLVSDRSNLGLQFEPYDDLTVAYAQKLLHNYEKITTKS